MNRLRQTLELFFNRSPQESAHPADSVADWERMSREITGTIYTLVALIQLIALVSYIPLDSFNIFLGRLDRMNNLGGVVGAIIAEGILGTVGIMGFSMTALTSWIAFSAFRGVPFKDEIPKILGTVLGTFIGSITCHVLFFDQFPEASLLQGGMIGRTIGPLLVRYFNTTGTMMLLFAGVLITLILTWGISYRKLWNKAFGESEEDIEAEKAEEELFRRVSELVHATRSKSLHSVTPKKPPRRRRKTKTENTDTTTPSVESTDDNEITEKIELDDTDAPKSEKGGKYSSRELISHSGSHSLPSPRLLKNYSDGGKKMSRGQIKENSRKLCESLLPFQITGEVVDVTEGPVLTTYEYKPSAGVKLKNIAALQDDLGIVMGTRELRIVAPIPGKTVVGIEVPRSTPQTISLKEVISEDAFFDKKLRIPIAIGKSTDGTPVFGDLAAMPHLLVAGATGTGKSVFINSLIMSFLFRMTPQELRLILIDPKMLELKVFDGLPHLVSNVITDIPIAYNALAWAVDEMEHRYSLMAKTGSKNIESFNSKVSSKDKKLPYIVIIVDELADLMLSGGEDVEIAITRLAQKARAAGIHLVIATQRPSTDVITGLIKANIPSRLSFKVPSSIDSRTILDTSGAEELIGRGDMLMIQPAIPMRRLHGCFVSEEELTRTVKNITGGRPQTKHYIDFSQRPDFDSDGE